MTPKTESELVEAIQSARAPLAVSGGATRGITVDGEPLSAKGLSGISLYEPGAMTLVAQSGTPISLIERTLAKDNQRLAFEPMDHRVLLGTKGEPTIGGVMAANVSGPRRIAVGAARDFALGVRFVDGSGTVIKNGGRVMKNVTGYDLVKLMAGSFGTLGVLTEVALKVLPMPETEGTLVLSGLDDAAAVAALASALGSPFEVTGAAHDPQINETMLRVEGFEASVNYRIEQLRSLLSETGAEMQVEDRDKSRMRWADLRDVRAFADSDGDVWRVSCKPSDAPGLVTTAKAQAVLFDWAGGLIWLKTTPGSDLRSALGTYDGHATLVRGSAKTRATLGGFQTPASGVARLSQGLRARFDPRGILNAGLMG
ncbi:2-hydroxy-acid oxidase [Sulfitobacter sp. SK012]|uniref:FAD-binding protein n=1 Tax=Sulfitobacter sp. SK012 TaxID=1389005 RepID=UPI000E09E587|nr:FAD-binding protein [Sulfitobacter sp. SK012]AXI48371.1 2-hydroxy-acid oxidase [Sulfitobacter sp. SK012]